LRFQDLLSGQAVSEPAVGQLRTAPADRRSISFVWSGDTAGQGWGIDPARGGMRTYATMLRNRPDFFVHCGDSIYADCTIPAQQKMPNGETWRNIVTEEKSTVATTLAGYRGNYKYNLLDANLREFNANVPIFAEPGRVYRKISYGPLLDLFMLDMRSYRGPNKAPRKIQYGPDAYLLGPAQLAAGYHCRQLARRLHNGWSRRRDRRIASLHAACRHSQYGMDHRRPALHGRAFFRSQQGDIPGL
jgi:alkaline phosphatase D